jgi:hypothetical protein
MSRVATWAVLIILSLSFRIGDARAYCRTTTCPLPPDFAPRPDACAPADFDSYCGSLHPAVKPLPLWWRNACISYDLQKDASRQVPYDVASKLAAAAFAQWTEITCSEGSDHGRASIDVKDLGPVSCGEVRYNKDHGNQHVIVFRDDAWPHQDANNTLALTTVTYSVDSGEIYDADMEVNGTVKLAAGDPVPADAYDLQSILTHEAGHFFGLAHSGYEQATMFAAYRLGTTSKRTLSADDTSGFCAVYLPAGKRSVDASQGGTVTEDKCDATPRHGFSTECAPAQ